MPRCFYCAEPFDGAQDGEHILPAAIGSHLVTRRVCTPCNRRAGIEIDRPWLRHPEIVQLRAIYKIPDRRGRVRPASWQGELGGGKTAEISVEGETVRVVPRPSESFENGIWTVEGYDDAAAEKKLQRLRRDHGDVRLISSESRPTQNLSATVTHTLDVDVWPRFGAKVALGVASLVVADDSWLDSSLAQHLRSVLWHGDPSTIDKSLSGPGVAWSMRPFSLRAGTHHLPAPQHLLIFEHDPESGDWLVIVTFGELLYRLPLPLDCSAIGAPPQSWRIDPITETQVQLPAVAQQARLHEPIQHVEADCGRP